MQLHVRLFVLLAACHGVLGQFPNLAGLKGLQDLVAKNKAGDKPLVNLLRGASTAAADDEPLLKPTENALVWQISGLQSEHKVPLQLVLTSKLAEAKGLPSGVRSNIIHTLSMDPQMRLRWLDDAACVEYLEKHFRAEYANMLRNERRGSFRGDICRAAVLYREGGFYTDLDLQLRLPLTQVVDKKTTFMSCFTADNAVLNAIVAAAPRSLVMKETLRELQLWYNSGIQKRNDEQGADGVTLTTSEWMGPLTMLRGLKNAMNKECSGKHFDSGQLRITCGKQELQMYREAELMCNEPSDECPQSRMNSEFFGNKFGIFELNNNDGTRRIVGWPRFDGCQDWGCHSGGWDETDMEKKKEEGVVIT